MIISKYYGRSQRLTKKAHLLATCLKDALKINDRQPSSQSAHESAQIAKNILKALVSPNGHLDRSLLGLYKGAIKEVISSMPRINKDNAMKELAFKEAFGLENYELLQGINRALRKSRTFTCNLFQVQTPKKYKTKDSPDTRIGIQLEFKSGLYKGMKARFLVIERQDPDTGKMKIHGFRFQGLILQDQKNFRNNVPFATETEDTSELTERLLEIFQNKLKDDHGIK